MHTPPGRCLFLVTFVVAISALAAPAVTAADSRVWLRPVAGPVVRPFAPPRTRFGPGHLGADLAAAPGTPVRAAGPGTVEFAGVVATTRHVVIRHAGGLRTSYSFLRTIAVRRGQLVGRGTVLGTSGGTGESHDGRVLHLGLRAGDGFVDPMRLFAEPDLAERVRLAPVAGTGSRPG
jgi:murein DD-endopeptidase MepM/ murein hydrolase activator NlpD